MIHILAKATGFITLFMICSCRNNHIDNRAENHDRPTQSFSKKTGTPVAVSAMELCAHFNTDPGMAITKYKDNLLVLSGQAEQVETAQVDHHCRNVIIRCAYADRKDTRSLSIVIQQCTRDETSNDTIVPGKNISIPCRFIGYQEGVILMEEVASAKK